MVYDIDTVGEWLEDSPSGRFSRHAIGTEDSVWICNECTMELSHCECDDAGELDPHWD